MPDHEIEDATTVRRALDAALVIVADLDLPALLRHVVSEARKLTGARYGALGVLNDEGTALAEFITVGLTADEEKRIGPNPTGLGVLGVVIANPAPLRLAHLDAHAQSVGFPVHHPAMTSFLGVPIRVRGTVYGNLYLTDKVGSPEFSDDDEAVVGAIAVTAGIAIENTRLHDQIQEVAAFKEREGFAKEQRDTVMRRIHEAGIKLDAISAEIGTGTLSDQLQDVIFEIDGAIRQLRSTNLDVGLIRLKRRVRERLLSLLVDLRMVRGFDIHATFEGPVDSRISDQLAAQLLAIVREAVINIGYHSRATEAEILLTVVDEQCQLRVSDNGRDMSAAQREQEGRGLDNLRRRAEKLQGDLTIENPARGGTVLTWTVPLDCFD
ncbi:MAG TPA: GAF domain-containing protein [Acidimicrobiales bacterium]|nr:GAF domain-containing protein [Acidimicrobiales bacterium]